MFSRIKAYLERRKQKGKTQGGYTVKIDDNGRVKGFGLDSTMPSSPIRVNRIIEDDAGINVPSHRTASIDNCLGERHSAPTRSRARDDEDDRPSRTTSHSTPSSYDSSPYDSSPWSSGSSSSDSCSSDSGSSSSDSGGSCGSSD